MDGNNRYGPASSALQRTVTAPLIQLKTSKELGVSIAHLTGHVMDEDGIIVVCPLPFSQPVERDEPSSQMLKR